MGRKHHVEDRTNATFTAIKKLWKKTRMSPTLREIGQEIGVQSTSLVLYYVDKLEAAGKIQRNGNKSRNILVVQPKSTKPIVARKEKVRVIPFDQNILDIPNFGPIAAGIPIHLPETSFKKLLKNQSDQEVVQIPESYLPQGVAVDDVFALHVEGNSMRDAMLTDGDIVVLQNTSIDNVKNGDIVAAWILDTQETTLKRFEQTKRGISLRPENPDYDPLFLQPDEVDIQGKLIAVLRFRY